MLDIDQFNRIIIVQGDGDDVVTIEITVQDTRGNGIAVQTNEEIKEGGPVRNDDGFFVGLLRKNFFRKVEGVVDSLFIAEVGKFHQIFQTYRPFSSQGIGFADKNMGLGCKERSVGEPIVIQHLDQDIPIEIIEEENPDF